MSRTVTAKDGMQMLCSLKVYVEYGGTLDNFSSELAKIQRS